METVSGASNWKLVFRREGGGVTILRAGTPDVRAVLPERLFGLPVTALGDRALAECTRCGQCAAACPADAIRFTKKGLTRGNR